MATAYKMWSRAGVRIDENGNQVWSDGYHIIDAANRTEAKLATGLPLRNDPHSESVNHLARSFAFAPKEGPTQYLCVVEYAVPPNGSFPEPTDDPLLRPWRWRVEASYEERANEMDVKRRIKRNSAGDIFPPRSARYRRRMIIGTRYERFWNIAKARRFENKTNLEVVTLGPVQIQPYEALIHSIEPASEFESDAEYLLMQYAIEVAVDERATPVTDENADPIFGYPFEHHQLDMGNRGWYTKDGKKCRGRFCYAKGTTNSDPNNRVLSDANDVQLDGTGKPKVRDGEQTIYVRSDDGVEVFAAESNPNTAEWLVGGTYAQGETPTQSPYSTVTNRMWLFKDHIAVSWQTLFNLNGQV